MTKLMQHSQFSYRSIYFSSVVAIPLLARVKKPISFNKITRVVYAMGYEIKKLIGNIWNNFSGNMCLI
jgi:hypothetical protein